MLTILTIGMQSTHLRTLLAIRDTGSFSAAASKVHLSHSAVSVQMKQLEHNLGAPVFEKGRRPARFTPLGEEIVEKARLIIEEIDDLRAIADADDLTGNVSIGFVATTLQTLLPVALTRMRDAFPQLQVSVQSGLSEQLAQAVEDRRLDFAFLSAPMVANRKVRLHEIGSELLYVVTSKSNTTSAKTADVLRQNPYISFNRDSWLGQQIAGHLAQLGIFLEPQIELDSVDAIELLVAQDFGVSILPQRLLAQPMENTLRCIAFGAPIQRRRVMLATQRHCRRQTLLACLLGIANGRA